MVSPTPVLLRPYGLEVGNINPFSTYALADRFTIPDYWIAGTQYGAATRGAEMCGDPGFNGLGWWSLDAGVTISGGKLNYTATTGTAYKNGSLSAGQYEVTYTIDSIAAGLLRVSSGTGPPGISRAAPGTYTETITILGANDYIAIGGGGAAVTAVVDNFSLKGIGINAIPGYAFTRSGQQGAVNASGAVQFFAANVPAITNAGYHSYVALTNILLQSQSIDNAAWSKSNCSVTADTSVAPDGTTTVDQITTTASPANIQSTFSPAATTAQTFSLFVPKTGGNFAYIWVEITDNVANSGFITFNLSTGVIGLQQISAGAGLTMVGYAIDCVTFWRVVITWVTTINVATNAVRFGPADAANTKTFAVNGNQSAWQIQNLAGNFTDGGPVIATTAAAASIGAPTLTETFSAPDEDYFVWCVATAGPHGVNQVFFMADDGTGNNSIYMARAPAGLADFDVITATVTLTTDNTTSLTGPGRIVMGIRRRAGKFSSIVLKGGVTTLSIETLKANPVGITTIRVGNYVGGILQANSQIEGLYRRVGTFTDADITAILAAA